MKKIKGTSGIIAFLLIFFLTGAIGLNINATKNIFLALVPWSLLLSYLFLIVYHRSSSNFKMIMIFLGIAVSGYLVELLGVITGHIFGQYTYGTTLGVKIMNVPLLIGMNWAMLVYCTYLIISNLKLPSLLASLLGGLLMTAYDFLMEPAAIALGMWHWEKGVIPVQNYIAWFIISSLFLYLVHKMKLNYHNRIAFPLFFIQAGFFGIQYLFVYLKSIL